MRGHAFGGCTAFFLAMALASGTSAATTTTAIAMKQDSGVYVVPVTLDGIVTIDCIVDSGAADVNIPRNDFRKLVRAGAISQADFVGTRDYMLADGSSEQGQVFRIRRLKVGGIEVKDVIASVGEAESSGLLGQSFLARFQSWSVDNGRHALLLVGPPAPPPVAHPVVAHAGDGTRGGDKPGPEARTVAQVSRHHGGGGSSRPQTSVAEGQAPADDDDGPPLVAQRGH